MQEIHHLHQRLLGLILAGHILEGDTGLLLHIHLGGTLAHAEAGSSAHLAEHKA